VKLLTTIFVFLGVFWTTSIFGHDDVSLQSSSPKHNAMLMHSPNELDLQFSQSVRLVKVSLKSIDGEIIQFGFEPSGNAKTNYQWKLPKLKPATYHVMWTILGEDGHAMKSKIGFMVH